MDLSPLLTWLLILGLAALFVAASVLLSGERDEDEP